MDGAKEFNSPQADTSNINLLGHYSGFISRLIAFSIDTVLISITVLAVTWFVGITLEILQVKPMLDFLSTQFPSIEPAIQSVLPRISVGLLIFLFTMSYHVFLWYFTGQTVGKALMGIRILPLEGGRIPLWRAFLRYFSYYLSGFILGLGFFWIIFDNRRMGWHDKIAHTCVLYTWQARPDERFLTYATYAMRARRRAIEGIKEQETRFKSIKRREDDLTIEKHLQDDKS